MLTYIFNLSFGGADFLSRYLFSDKLGVSGSVEKRVKLGSIAHLYLDDPIPIRVLVDEFRCILQSLVLLHNDTADRAYEVA